jgi:hypothetical protein
MARQQVCHTKTIIMQQKNYFISESYSVVQSWCMCMLANTMHVLSVSLSLCVCDVGTLRMILVWI